MFMAPVEGKRVWDTQAVFAMLKFLRRVWALVTGGTEAGIREVVSDDAEPTEVKVAVNTLIQNITEDMERLRLNTAVSELMKFVNAAEGQPLSQRTVESFIKVLSPMAPHLAEELWERAGHKPSIAYEPWPTPDQAVLDAAAANVEVVLQVLGKKRGVLTVASTLGDGPLTAAALEFAEANAKPHLPPNPKAIVVRDKATGRPRLVNVVKG
jgi:leucyl-tRNA synthetase